MSITFKNVETGFKFPPVVQSYVQSAIDHYALASLDLNPVHTNEEWAARAKAEASSRARKELGSDRRRGEGFHWRSHRARRGRIQPP
jgi:acyl dehydratase